MSTLNQVTMSSQERAERRTRAVQRVRAGESTKAVAASEGLKYSYLRKLLDYQMANLSLWPRRSLRVLELLHQGYSDKQISRVVGMRPCSVERRRMWEFREDITIAPQSFKDIAVGEDLPDLNDICRVEVVELLSQGKSIYDVMVATGLGHAFISAVATRHGYNAVEPSNAAWTILADLLNTSDTLERIGQRRGVSKQRVSQILQKAREHGIRVRD